MIPRPPQRRPQLGFVYVPPYRVQGISVAGEETVVQVPELDVCFDIGLCPRPVLTSNFVALSHGHMDHAAGLAYYFSQRHFQGMGVGTLLCHPRLERPIRNVMTAWIDVEAQKTPHTIVPMEPGQELQIRKNTFIRAVETSHTVPALGFVIVERRSKLRPELVGLEQEQIVARKARGESITQTVEIPLVAYLGDTEWAEHFTRPDVLGAKILITECTFLDPEDRPRVRVGKHLHLDDIVRLLEVCQSEAVILTHLSRRTHLGQARRRIDEAIKPEDRDRLFLLMDHRGNRARYEQHQVQAGQSADEQAHPEDE